MGQAAAGASYINNISGIAASAMKSLSGFLAFSPADDRIAYRKGMAVSVERGRVTVIAGTGFLSRTKLKGMKEYSFDPSSYPDPESVASSVAMAVEELGIKKPIVTLALPKAWIVFGLRDFPSTIKENMAEALGYELDRITPFSADEAMYDFRVVDEKAGRMMVLVAAAKAGLVDSYVAALGGKGISVKSVRSGLASVSAMFHRLHGRRDFIFLQETAASYEAVLILDSAPAGIVSANRGEKSLDAFILEMGPLFARLRETGRSGCILLHSSDRESLLKQTVGPKAGVPVITMDELLSRAGVHDSGAVLHPDAAACLTEELRPGAEGLDLLSGGIRGKKQIPLLLTMVLGILILSSLLLYIYAPLEIEKKRSQELDRQIASRRDEIRKVELLKKQVSELSSEISTINSFREKRPSSLAIVKEATTVLPNSAWLTRLRVSSANVEAEGYASSASELIPKFEASRLFSRVELASTTVRDQKMNADRFSIKMEIEGAIREEKTGVQKK